MNAKPFRFLASNEAVARLCSRLSRVGLDLIIANDYEIQFVCSWMDDTSIALRWQFNWWPDGILQEDAAADLVVNSEIRDRVEIDEMLNRSHGRPLREEISDRIVAMVSAFTAKSA